MKVGHLHRRIWVVLAAALLLSCALCAATFPTQSAFAADAPSAQKRVVRVGYFQFDGYHMMGDGGTMSGYGYELMEDLARYSNWDLEFVGYDKSWSEMQQMLADGQIDVLTSAQKTADRTSRFAFSDKDVGTSSMMLTVKSGNAKYRAGDYSSYNGMRVGMIIGSTRNDTFANFAVQHGFTYTPVYYESNDALVAALQDGSDIDAIATSSLRSTQGEWTLEQFGDSPFYVMTRLDDADLMAQVNYGIAQMDEDNPDWRTQLNRKYYTSDSGDQLSLTDGEEAYIAQMNQMGVVYKVLANPDWRPYSYYEDGQVKGILPTIFQQIADRCGIQYEFIDTPTRADYKQAVDANSADIILDSTFGLSSAQVTGYQITDSYTKISIAGLTLKSPKASTGVVCMPMDLQISLGLNGTLQTNGTDYITRETTQECLDALRDGSCDAVYLYADTARAYMNADERNQLTMSVIPEYSVSVYVAVNKRLDSRLVSVLDKGVHSVEGSDVARITQEQGDAATNRTQTLLGFVYDNPLLVAGLLVLFGLLTVALIVTRMRTVHARQDAKRQVELERFMGYACQLNDLVMEVDLQNATCTRYLLEDGKVRMDVEDQPYHDDSFVKAVVHPDDLETTLRHNSIRALRVLATQGGEDHLEVRAAVKPGEYHWFLVLQQGVPADAEHPCNVVLFIRDIDDIKRVQEQTQQALSDALIAARQASVAKGSFLSRMSHEIRTPLNAVMGYLTLAQMPDADFAQVMHCVEGGQAAADHLLEIINDVLDVSAIEAGRMKIAHEAFDIVRMTEDLNAIFMAQAAAKGIDFNLQVHDVDQQWVIGDKMRVSQVLSNLLSNAIKFTDTGGSVQLVLRQMDASDSQDHFQFRVEDTGKGMSAEYMEHLYEPFEQEDAAIAQEFGGSGLGLSITRNLVDLMNGSIDVESKPGAGTAFTVTFAFNRPDKQEQGRRESAAASVASAADGVGDYSGCRVLVVEDNTINSEIIVEMVRRFKVDIDTACDGRDALEKFTSSKPGTYQAIFMDVRMPRMNGYEATRAIRHCEHPDAASIPIIAMTADAFTEDVTEALASGMNAHMSKPVSMQSLSRIFSRYVRK